MTDKLHLQDPNAIFCPRSSPPFVPTSGSNTILLTRLPIAHHPQHTVTENCQFYSLNTSPTSLVQATAISLTITVTFGGGVLLAPSNPQFYYIFYISGSQYVVSRSVASASPESLLKCKFSRAKMS